MGPKRTLRGMRDVISLAVVAALVTVVSAAEARDQEHKHHAGGAASTHGAGTTGALTRTAASPAASTVAELWRLVRTRESEVHAIIVTRTLTELRPVADGLRDLVARLPAVSRDLTEDRRDELASAARSVATLAERLGAAGAAGDQSAAEASLRQLDSVLDTIEALYPRGALGADPETRIGGRATITGEIVAASCYLEKGEAGRGPAHRECALRCIAEGRPPFVRDEETGRLYLAAFPDSTSEERERWLAQVGNRVRVTGRIEERDGTRLLEVEEVRGEHDHEAAPHGGVVGMAGEHHLEVVTTADDEIRVYLLDAFMTPLSVAGMKGVVLVKGVTARRSTLAPDPAGESLRVIGTRLAPGDEEITVTLELQRAPLTMTLPFRRADAAAPRAGKRAAADAKHEHDHRH